MIDGGHRDAFHPNRPDPACPECQRTANGAPLNSRKMLERSMHQDEVAAPRLSVVRHLSLVLFEPADDASYAALCALLDEQCGEGQEPLFFGRSLVVEPRYAEAVASQLRADGFEVQTP
jgi:hypothetical protein